MADGRRRTAKSGGEGKSFVKNGGNEITAIAMEDDKSSTIDSEIGQLRGRWELASVLNFLSVFEPVIGGDLKLIAEDIESGLVTPNSSNTELHIKLLKGIPPVSKTLNGTDAWVTVLCKKLAMWWPWVAEGEMPLTVANGKEISSYKELNPTNRLLILKALCEIRAEQDDVVSYINDALKNGTEVSNFRKDKVGGVGGVGDTTAYWYDASKIIGHRLYKGVSKIELKTPTKGRASKRMPATSLHWETLATNLEEFQTVVGELSSSKVLEEVAVGKTIDNDFIPAVVKFQKKKEMALKRKQREENLVNNFRPYTGSMRSCRNCRAVSYTFDDYDRAIDEAIKVTRNSKRLGGQKNEMHRKEEEIGSDGVSDEGKDLNGKGEDSETESDRFQDAGNNNDMEDDDDYDDKRDDIKSGSEPGNSDEEKAGCGNKHHKDQSLKSFGSRWSMRLAGVAASNSGLETGNFGAKNRLRQRPTHNSALAPMKRGSDDDNSVVPDSDESLVKDAKSGSSANEDASQVADSEEDDENSSQHENSGLSVHAELSEVADSEEDSDG